VNSVYVNLSFCAKLDIRFVQRIKSPSVEKSRFPRETRSFKTRRGIAEWLMRNFRARKLKKKKKKKKKKTAEMEG